MEVQVEDIGPCKKLLKIEIPKEQVDEELDKTYSQLNESIVFPGFRKGRVPRWLLQNKFSKQVNEDARDALVAASFKQAVQKQNLKPVGEPKFDEDIAVQPGEPLSFGVTIEVEPEFEIDGYTGIPLKKPSVEPTQAEIDQRVEAIRRRYAKLEDVTEGAPQKEDIVLCHLVLREGEEVYRDVSNHQFIVGEHVLVGMDLDETTGFVTGAQVGGTVERDITLPDDYPDEAKRGSTITLSLTLEKIRRPVLPEVTDEWTREIGFDDLEDFHEEIRASIRREKEQHARADLEEQLDEQLLKKADFELPEDVIGRMADRTLVRRSLALRYRGVPPEEIRQNLETLQAESRDLAERSAKLFFILSKIADKERLFVTEEEVNARIEAMAASDGRSPEQVRRELEQSDGLSELRHTMREEKVRAFLLEKAEVKKPKGSGKKAKSKP